MLARSTLGALLLVAGAAKAAAQPRLVFSAPRSGDVLRAGDSVEVRWSGVADGAEEMELLLSLDGGLRTSVRLTGELPGSSRSWVWTVPNLVAPRAALVLRVGAEEEESVAGASAVFSIAPDPSLAPETMALREGELWISRAPRPDDALPLAALGGDGERVRSGKVPPEVVARSGRAGIGRSRDATRTTLGRIATPSRLLSTRLRRTPSSSPPLRI